MKTLAANYTVDAQWRIVAADTEFCRLFRVSHSGIVGRDVRELLRQDFRHDFRRYVARALVGTGEAEATFPMVAPCGEEKWVGHALEPLMVDGTLSGFKAELHLRNVAKPGTKPWWRWRGAVPHLVWDAEVDQLAIAS